MLLNFSQSALLKLMKFLKSLKDGLMVVPIFMMIGRWSDPRLVSVFHSVLVMIDVEASDIYMLMLFVSLDGTLVGWFS